ncbi:MAG TPA: PorV/PorQ family protein [Elusimicrobiota bacterium]|nr:PorV/PorQ family protein [Elusimicrobiota bacterium]
MSEKFKVKSSKGLLLLALNLTLSTFNCFATEGAGTVAVPFLRMAVGPRAAGMGEAFTAVSDDSTALFWNPAGLGGVRRNEVYASHQTWLEDARLSHAAFARPVGRLGTFGVGLAYVGSGVLEGRNESDVVTGNFDMTDLAVTLGAGRPFFNFLQAGVNVKMIQQTIADEKGSGFAADAGALWRIPLPEQVVVWGVSVNNVGGKIGPGEKADLPTAAHVGVCDRLLRETVLLSVEGVLPQDTDFKVNAGAEFLVGGFLALRGGYRFRQDDVSGVDGLSAGFGLRYSQKQDYFFDYSFSGQGDLGASHRVSLTLRF